MILFHPKLPRNQEKLPRSSSIDSLVDVVWNNETESNLVTLPKLLMVQETSNRRESLLSPRRTKQSRGINCKRFWLFEIAFAFVDAKNIDSIMENTETEIEKSCTQDFTVHFLYVPSWENQDLKFHKFSTKWRNWNEIFRLYTCFFASVYE